MKRLALLGALLSFFATAAFAAGVTGDVCGIQGQNGVRHLA